MRRQFHRFIFAVICKGQIYKHIFDDWKIVINSKLLVSSLIHFGAQTCVSLEEQEYVLSTCIPYQKAWIQLYDTALLIVVA